MALLQSASRQEDNPSATSRHAYLDWVRGLAVLIMIEAHVLDSWTRASDRLLPIFGYAMVLGGLGAPLFLFLAGVASVLSAESRIRRTGDYASAWWAVQRRGWQVFGLAFLFRLQSFILGGATDPMGLLKVDILNVMGPAIVATGLIGRAAKAPHLRAILFVFVAAAVAMVTPIVRSAIGLRGLPDPVEWYFRPTPGRTNFTLFPWAGFVFAGAGVAAILGALQRRGSVTRAQVCLAAASVVLGVVAYLASFLPTIYQRSEFWTSSPTFFFLRTAIVTLMLPIGFAWERAPWRGTLTRWRPLEMLGRSSLFVYWVHVEMVYGFPSSPLRRGLSLTQALVAYVLFTAFLVLLVRLKTWLIDDRRDSTAIRRGPRPASI